MATSDVQKDRPADSKANASPRASDAVAPDSSGTVAPEPSVDRPPRTLLRRADQLGIAVLSLAALFAIGGYWISQAVVRHRLIDLDRAALRDPGFRVDINAADWPELAQLPEIGESLAKQIVAWREANGPFKALTDLRRVKGIGPKKFEAIRPFVLPLDPAAPAADPAVADQERQTGAAAP